MAERLRELQDLSRVVSFSYSGACLPYVPKFVSKTESALKSLPRSCVVNSLNDFVAVLDEELLLCPVRSLREYLKRTSSFVDRSHHFFSVTSFSITSYVQEQDLLEMIFESGACNEDGEALRAHSVHGIATSSAFFKNWSVSSVMDAASWSSNSVITSFYFKDLRFVYESLRSLGPVVASGERIG